MKKFIIIGIGLLLGIGLLSVVACKRTKEVEFVVLASGEQSRYTLDYYQIITDEAAYRQCENRLSVSLPAVDFSAWQVVAVFDTVRPHPLYHIGIAKITEEDNYVNVQVKRDCDSRQGGYSQAYVLARMPRIQKSVHFETLPFIGDETGYIPQEGVSPCLNHAYATKAGNETLYFKFVDDGVLWLEHRGMELNCAPTILVETSVRLEKDYLYVNEDERLGADSMLALCTCAKIVGYKADGIVPEADSLQLELVFSTFERGQRSRSFKIPSSGSGEVLIGERLWP